MIDWTRSMQQTFEFYQVDPGTWKNYALLSNIRSCTINRDDDSETLETASIECEAVYGEIYIRVYLVCTQDDATDKFPLGTFLVQTPSTKYDGRSTINSLDAYSPLLELKDQKPPYGYSLLKGTVIMKVAPVLASENLRAPVVYNISKDGSVDDETTLPSDFLSDFNNDTWLSFLSDLIANAKYKFSLDELSRVLIAPVQKTASLQPVWVYNDDNSSILYPDITFDKDLYGIPNVVEVLYSTDGGFKFATAENNDTSSIVSIPNRGRRIVHRESNPKSLINPTQEELDAYAKSVLDSASTATCSVTYKHGYCPVRVGDCVLLNYRRAGLNYVKARVTSQTIVCQAGCEVTEKATYTTKLWEVAS